MISKNGQNRAKSKSNLLEIDTSFDIKRPAGRQG